MKKILFLGATALLISTGYIPASYAMEEECEGPDYGLNSFQGYQHRLEKEGGSLYYSELREANREALEADEMRRKGKIARKHLTFETSLDTGVSDSDESYVDPDEEIVH